MSTQHDVAQGECISSIAFENGFFPDTLWNHPANAKLKQLRQDPSVLRPGDCVVIPDKRPKTIALNENNRYRFRRKGVPKFLRIRIMRVNRPLAGLQLTIAIDGRPADRRQTDKDGWLVCPIPPNAAGALILMMFRWGRRSFYVVCRRSPKAADHEVRWSAPPRPSR